MENTAQTNRKVIKAALEMWDMKHREDPGPHGPDDVTIATYFRRSRIVMLQLTWSMPERWLDAPVCKSIKSTLGSESWMRERLDHWEQAYDHGEAALESCEAGSLEWMVDKYITQEAVDESNHEVKYGIDGVLRGERGSRIKVVDGAVYPLGYHKLG